MNREKLIGKRNGNISRCPVWFATWLIDLTGCLLENSIKEGDNPVTVLSYLSFGAFLWVELFESATRSWRYVSPKANYKARPIVNKYREGKLKSTLKREWKVRETVEGELEWALPYPMPWFILGHRVVLFKSFGESYWIKQAFSSEFTSFIHNKWD